LSAARAPTATAAPLRVAVAGASGRMGRTLVEAVLASDDLALGGALDVAGSPALGQDAAAFLGRASGVTIVADLDTGLVNADVLIDCGAWPFPIDHEGLRAANPQLITVQLTPWGATGPKAHWRATDLTLFASSGQLAVTGDSDRPPVRISVPQAWLHTASNAAVGAMVALEHRARTGVGQHVDCSAQQSVVETALSADQDKLF